MMGAIENFAQTDRVLAQALSQSSAARSQALAKNAKHMTPEKALEVGREFEAMFLSQMLAPMFEGISSDGPFGGGFAEESYRGMLIEEYGKMLSQDGGVGIAEAIQRELLHLQEV